MIRNTGPTRCPRPRAACAAPGRTSLFAGALFCLGLAFAVDSSAQTFTRVRDTGPHVTDEEKSLSGAWADYDADGDADLVVTDIGRFSVFRNDGAEAFFRVPGVSDSVPDLVSTTPVWGDFDNDGDLDLYRSIFTFDVNGSASVPLPNRLYRNDPGGFVELTASPAGLDSTYCPASSWVDYDRDGDVDLFAVGALGTDDLMFRNDGGAFVRRTGLPFLTPTPGGVIQSWIDYDGDGDQDLYVVNHSAPNELFRNLIVETGVPESFEPDTTSGLTDDTTILDFSVSWGDYDNDGDLDAFVATSGQDRLYENQGDGTFVRILGIPLVSGAVTSSCGSWGDYDNDGDLDLFVPHAPVTNAVPDLWRNDGGGVFVLADSTAGEILNALPGPQASEWGDYDDDGDLDLYIVNWRALPAPGGVARKNRLYRNEGTTNHWLQVRLEGTTSNRAAIGARVRVYATIGGQAVQQVREVAGGPTSFEFQRELRTHFGLGDATMADSVVVEWPSGGVQTLTNVVADQEIHVLETTAVGSPIAGARAPAILAAWPNPFAEGTVILLRRATAGETAISVHDVAGRAVRRLSLGDRPAGVVEIRWDGRDDNGRSVAAGVYFVRVEGEGGSSPRKLVRLR